MDSENFRKPIWFGAMFAAVAMFLVSVVVSFVIAQGLAWGCDETFPCAIMSVLVFAGPVVALVLLIATVAFSRHSVVFGGCALLWPVIAFVVVPRLLSPQNAPSGPIPTACEEGSIPTEAKLCCQLAGESRSACFGELALDASTAEKAIQICQADSTSASATCLGDVAVYRGSAEVCKEIFMIYYPKDNECVSRVAGALLDDSPCETMAGVPSEAEKCLEGIASFRARLANNPETFCEEVYDSPKLVAVCEARRLEGVR